MYSQMEREAANNPSSRGSRSRIDMAIWGGDTQRAADLALAAANANPTNVKVSSELLRLMERAGRTGVAGMLRDRLAKLR